MNGEASGGNFARATRKRTRTTTRTIGNDAKQIRAAPYADTPYAEPPNRFPYPLLAFRQMDGQQGDV
jgi:hypothetical protein